ncbi:hypothetical protein GCM10009765_03340 [Fodinicola feengrottensis]|uniref:Uncharacterized protein n=1 Tax=Fodinicola feengrottensis TaxID=435914 RepID=A0ABP4RRF3_9ACTN
MSTYTHRLSGSLARDCELPLRRTRVSPSGTFHALSRRACRDLAIGLRAGRTQTCDQGVNG